MKTERTTTQTRQHNFPTTSFQVPFTAFPNELLDQVMPQLKDTEWRVLCVVVRQTCGWRRGQTAERKRSDWLTHRQLMRRTGRASAAICRAIEHLVEQQLIEVHTEWGALLPGALERRRCGTRLYYRLHPNIYTSQRQ
jgi:hypothetical protein